MRTEPKDFEEFEARIQAHEDALKAEHPEQEIHFLSPVICMCATMYRIDLAHLCWSLENLAAGTIVNQIEVDEETSRWSLVALERMLEVK